MMIKLTSLIQFLQRRSASMKSLFHLMFCFLLIPALANGHDVDVTGVARIFLDEQSHGSYSLSVVDQQVPPLFNIERILPERCEGLPPGNFAYRFQCNPALNIDDSLSFPWSLEGLVAIARWADGEDVSGYFPGSGVVIQVPLNGLKAGASSLGSLAYRYLVLGADHILFGIDHLLFVLGLLLLLTGFWKLLQTITAFTVAHSITLACAVLEIFPAPGPPIEVLIALSILMLAREVVMSQRGQMTLVHQKPWIVAFVFGLFHGFGFAGALGELGLRDSDIPLALLFFNLGVEGGQVVFIATMISANWFFGKFSSDGLTSIHRGLAYGLGGIAFFWFLERLPALFVPS
tara:strand:+ start:480 stop:1520 length:1041 start_codon:yes stop_codon:yes gene_type:complete